MPATRTTAAPALPPARTEPMYATVGDALPTGTGWTFEPKYDGIRVLAHVSGSSERAVQLVTRNGRDKAAQFPEVVDALRALGRRARRTLVLDGEIVALDRPGTGGRFQALQSRMHATDAAYVATVAARDPAVLVAFDLLQDGASLLLDRPWTERRARLERLLARRGDGDTVRASETTADGDAMLDRARAAGWEGVIAKRTDAPYRPGARARDWRKLKLQHRAEFVVGGWTEPRNSRPHLGALLLGYFDDAGLLRYVGHMGGGFTRAGLQAMRRRLDRLARRTSPFADPPRTNEPAHWVRPEVVVEVKFAEWTADGRLRQPIFLGERDDKPAREVHLERRSLQDWAMGMSGGGGRRAAGGGKRAAAGAKRAPTGAPKRAPTDGGTAALRPPPSTLVDQLTRIERDGGDGELRFESGAVQRVSSLDKVYFPEDGITKGDVMRYYVRVADAMLPLIRDRPLALRRFPDGIHGQSFFQQKALGDMPEGVRTAEVETADEEVAPRLVGGNLETLLHGVQLGAIAVHAWLSRVRTRESADVAVIDLDPGDGVPFSAVVSLARTVGRVTDELGLNAAIKTSGSRGIHVGIPLPPRTPYERAARIGQAIAEEIVAREPALATLERRIAKRPRGSIYVDVQQNAMGKSVVAPYSVRAKPGATVSAPLRWTELRASLRLGAFTVISEPRRLTRVGDLWGEALRAGNDARRIRAAGP